VTAEAKQEVEATLYTALLYALAALAGLGTVVFLTILLFWFLESHFGSMWAAAIEAAIFAIAAALLAVWAATPREATPAGKPTEAQPEPAPDETLRLAEASENMGVDLEEVGKTLAAAGYRMESLIVMASTDILRQLSPLQFVSLVFVGSFLFGRRLRRG
jgi:hypothetical protein